MKNKILFLDIDGVLNSEEWYTERVNQEGSHSYPIDEFSPKLVERLNEIIAKTGVSIVVSSTWRVGRTIEELQELFKLVGIEGEIIGRTPSSNSRIRGNEIKEWLNIYMNSFNTDNFKAPDVTTYAIIDDDSDMLSEQFQNFFQTSCKQGLTEDIKSQIIEHFKTEDLAFER